MSDLTSAGEAVSPGKHVNCLSPRQDGSWRLLNLQHGDSFSGPQPLQEDSRAQGDSRAACR